MNNIKSDLERYAYGRNISTMKLILIALTKLGFWAVINYRLGMYLRYKTKDIKVIFHIVCLLTSLSRLFIEIITGISISYHSNLGPGILIAHFSNIIIGDGVIVGKNATLHQGVTIGVSGSNELRGVPNIGDDFFAGANAVIAGRIIIGDSVSISANVFVSNNIDSNSLVINSNNMVIKKVAK